MHHLLVRTVGLLLLTFLRFAAGSPAVKIVTTASLTAEASAVEEAPGATGDLPLLQYAMVSGLAFGDFYLQGGTPRAKREQMVTEFQDDSQGPAVFVLSIKAGGVGLNLTGADTVVHYDPWWNPAAEAQATDRAHRIGQTRVVTSYKLIAAGTVEEKVLALQDEKRALLANGERRALVEQQEAVISPDALLRLSRR